MDNGINTKTELWALCFFVCTLTNRSLNLKTRRAPSSSSLHIRPFTFLQSSPVHTWVVFCPKRTLKRENGKQNKKITNQDYVGNSLTAPSPFTTFRVKVPQVPLVFPICVFIFGFSTLRKDQISRTRKRKDATKRSITLMASSVKVLFEKKKE